MGLDSPDYTKSSPSGACFRNVIRPFVNVERDGGRPLWLRMTASGRTWLHVRKVSRAEVGHLFDHLVG
jgi:hypothetical protein